MCTSNFMRTNEGTLKHACTLKKRTVVNLFLSPCVRKHLKAKIRRSPNEEIFCERTSYCIINN